MQRHVRAITYILFVCYGVLTAGRPLFSADTALTGAEELWQRLQTASKGFYKMQPPSLERTEFDEFLRNYSRKAGELADAFKSYRERYTNSPQADKAWDQWMDFLVIAAHGDARRKTELEKAEQKYLDDPTLDRRRRQAIRSNQIERTSDMKERERLIRAVSSELPESKMFFCHQILQIASWSDFPHSRNIVEEILTLTEGKQELDHYRREALEIKQMLDRIGHPLELKFTGLGGETIDLTQYRVKVVLLDFWATWCPPCVAGIPKVKSLWTKARKDGFEVIGITYDTEQRDLEKFLKTHDLGWPQFFDPEGSDAPLVQSLGKPGPPSYWLISRRGVLVDVNGSSEMEQKVNRLLAEKAP